MPAKNGSFPALLKLLAVLIVVVAVGLGVALQMRPVAYAVPVRLGLATDAVTGSVVVHAAGDIKELKSEAAGRVAWCAALDPGASFRKGDVLLRLDTTELVRGQEEARRNHTASRERYRIATEKNSEELVARQTLENAQRLNRLGNVSTEDVKRAERGLDEVLRRLALAKFDAAKAEEDFKNSEISYEATLKKMTILAPLDGMVHGATVWEGALIHFGAGVATIYSNERAVVMTISEEDISKVKLGQKAQVLLLGFRDEYFEASVMKILPIAEANTQRFTVFLDVKAPLEKLMPYSTGEGTITIGQRENQPLIPRRALFAGNHVNVVANGRVERRQVEVGFKSLNLAEVTKGLAPGEQVIVEDVESFLHGQHVRVQAGK